MSAAPRLCSQCHARLILDTSATQCPACGGALVADPAPDATPVQADHRGIVLPPRHAVGGVISPR